VNCSQIILSNKKDTKNHNNDKQDFDINFNSKDSSVNCSQNILSNKKDTKNHNNDKQDFDIDQFTENITCSLNIQNNLISKGEIDNMHSEMVNFTTNKNINNDINN